ncbi:MAG TPA: ribonuclease [Casimicrobiaceae bacterium]|nr:ribonuclease [Casimicrobiaceae bacterium]
MTPARTKRDRIPGVAVAFAMALALAVAGGAPLAIARTSSVPLPEIALADLPKEAKELRAQIDKGGPFHYDRDGVVFGNREHILPAKPRGYYHEYTVRTPGARDRGARRMVCGGPKTMPDVCYYSDDHYQSFRRIRS